MLEILTSEADCELGPSGTDAEVSDERLCQPAGACQSPAIKVIPRFSTRSGHGQSVQAIQESPALQALVPAEQSAEEWMTHDLDPPETHP